MNFIFQQLSNLLTLSLIGFAWLYFLSELEKEEKQKDADGQMPSVHFTPDPIIDQEDEEEEEQKESAEEKIEYPVKKFRIFKRRSPN